MAKLTVSGFDELENRLKAIEKGLRGEAMQNMLYAGADVMINAWRGSIEGHHHIRSSQMLNSVGKTGVNVGRDGLEISVYPMGTDSHRVNNAQKAYILHYGRQPTKKGTEDTKADRFGTEAERAAKPQGCEAMQRALNEYIAGK